MLGLAVSALPPHGRAELGQRKSDPPVIGAEHPLADRHGLADERLGAGVIVEMIAHHSQEQQGLGRLQVRITELRAPQRERVL